MLNLKAEICLLQILFCVPSMCDSFTLRNNLNLSFHLKAELFVAWNARSSKYLLPGEVN
jgi:hypothetical protein